MKKKIRVGLAGLGRIGWSFHAPTLARHPDCELSAVADPAASRREEAARTWGCPVFEDVETMIARAGLDAVVLAVPTHLHAAYATRALHAGLHVMLEKPMTATLAEARALIRLARRRKRVLTVYQPHRLAAYYQHLRALVRDGRIGRLIQIRAGIFSYVRRDDWQALRRYGGGMLANYGSHFLDQMLDLAGAPIRRLFGRLARIATLGDAEDAVKVVFETREGVLGDLEINMGSALAPYHLEVYGSCGAIRLEKEALFIRWFDPKALAGKTLDLSLASRDRKYPTDQISWQEATIPVDESKAVDVYADFAEAIRTGRPPFVPPKESLRVMEAVEQVRRSCGRRWDFRPFPVPLPAVAQRPKPAR